MREPIFEKDEIVQVKGKLYTYIEKQGIYHFVKSHETGLNCYKENVNKLKPESKSDPKQPLKKDQENDVFDHALKTWGEELKSKGIAFDNIINEFNQGDWRDYTTIIPDESIDLSVIDPPYGVKWKSNRSMYIDHKKIKDDDNLKWLPKLVDEIYRVLKDDSHIYIFCSHHTIESFKNEFGRKFKYKNTLIWDKKQGTVGDLKGNYSTHTEFVLFFVKGKGKPLNGKRDGNILRHARTKNTLHPTQKPVELIRYLISKSSKENDIVLDFFAGSFSLAKACKLSGRNFVCVEWEEKYVEDAKKEILKYNRELF